MRKKDLIEYLEAFADDAEVKVIGSGRMAYPIRTVHMEVGATGNALLVVARDAETGAPVVAEGFKLFTPEEVGKIAFTASGAATGILLNDFPDYVFPSTEVSEAVNRALEEEAGFTVKGDGSVVWAGTDPDPTRIPDSPGPHAD